MIAHDKAAELQPGLYERFFSVMPELHFGVIIFQVAVIAIGAEIAPFAQDGIPEKTVVRFA
jgi:hypothetical protein